MTKTSQKFIDYHNNSNALKKAEIDLKEFGDIFSYKPSGSVIYGAELDKYYSYQEKFVALQRKVKELDVKVSDLKVECESILRDFPNSKIQTEVVTRDSRSQYLEFNYENDEIKIKETNR